MTTINSVCTINTIVKNNLVLEVMPNTISDNSLQFYYLDQSGNTITNYFDFNDRIQELIKRNKLLYITFCGISNKDHLVPEYLYITFHGSDIISYLGKQNKNIDFDFNLIETVLKIKYPNLKYHIFVFNIYHQEFYIKKIKNTTYLNIFWNPNNITNITNFTELDYNNINKDFIEQRYITPYGIEFGLRVFKEVCIILDEDYNNFIFIPNYNLHNNLG